jgi:hypothetical protein
MKAKSEGEMFGHVKISLQYLICGQWKNHEKGDLFMEGKSLELFDDFTYLLVPFQNSTFGKTKV